MVKEQLLLVNKASDPVVVPLMSVVIDVDAVSDEAAAMRHLEASNPAIMVVLGGDMRAPRAFATYKVNLSSPQICYYRDSFFLHGGPMQKISSCFNR